MTTISALENHLYEKNISFQITEGDLFVMVLVLDQMIEQMNLTPVFARCSQFKPTVKRYADLREKINMRLSLNNG